MKSGNSSKPVAGYFRISKARDEMKAPAIYRGQIEDYCRYKKLGCLQVFEDIDFSGRRGAKPRPALTELLERRHEFSAVITPKLTRFGRSLGDLYELFNRFDDDGIGLVFLDVEVDTRTAGGKLVRNIMAAFANYETDLISERWRDVARYLKKNGRRNGGFSTPLGYRYDRVSKSYEIVPHEADVVREVFRRFLAGDAITSIVSDFNTRRVPTKNGGVWHTKTVARMLETPMLAGHLQLDDELIRGVWDPIIDMDTFDSASTLRKAQRAAFNGKPREGKGAYLLSGLLKCGICGTTMHRMAKAGTRQSDMYACPNSRPRQINQGKTRCAGGAVSERRAEDYVVGEFIAEIGALHSRNVKRKVTRLPAPRDRSTDLEARVVAIDRHMDRLVEMTMRSTGKAADRAFDRQMRALEAEREAAEAGMLESRSHYSQTVRRTQDIDELRTRLGDLSLIWQHANLDERRRLLRLAIDAIDVVGRQPKRFDIVWADWVK
ncbi:MAG: recombinase family protein [Actinomycetota bacterium]